MTTHWFRWLGLLPTLVILVVLGMADPAAGQDEDGAVPPSGQGGVTKVEINVDVNDIVRIDERDGVFVADVQLVAAWTDDRSRPIPCTATHLYVGDAAEDKLKTIWSPGFHVVDSTEPRKTDGLALSVSCSGKVDYEEQFVATIHQRFAGLVDFPFDRHPLEITVEVFRAEQPLVRGEVKQQVKLIDIQKCTAGEKFIPFDSEEWKFAKECSAVDEQGTSATTVIEIERKSGYYGFNVIAPLFIIVAISWTVFWMGPNLAERLGVSITILLTVVAYDFLTSDNLPKLSYETRLDSFYSVSYFFVALTVLVSVVATRMSAARAEEGVHSDGDATSDTGENAEIAGAKANPLDRVSRHLFPVLYLTLAAVALGGVWASAVEPPTSPRSVLGIRSQDVVELEDELEDELAGGLTGELEDELAGGLTGEISGPNEFVTVEVCGTTPGEIMFVRMTAPESGALDPYLEVYDIDGNPVTYDDDSGGGLNSLVRLDFFAGDECYFVDASDSLLENSGEYTLNRLTENDVVELGLSANEISAEDFDEGFEEDFFLDDSFFRAVSFEEIFERPIADVQAGAIGLEPGNPQASGRIEDSKQIDPYSLCHNGPGKVVVRMKSTDIDPLLVVYLDGIYVDFNDDDPAGFGLDSVVELDALPAEQCYLVIAKGLVDSIGDYTIAAVIQE